MQYSNWRDKLSLDYLFHPRSIAIAGVSSDQSKFSAGLRFLKCLTDFGFEGKIYPIGSNGGEALGLKVYSSISDIPDSVDYVISAIPSRYAPQLVKECANKGVRAIHFFTSGFSEIEDDVGEQLESEILNLAQQSGIRILGPNCMGLYYPKTGLTYTVGFPEQSAFPRRSGSVGLIAQSGGNSLYGVREATTRGIYFSKGVSYGNACDLNETDFLEYLADDPETEIITAYIEGVKDGPRFARVLRRATEVKPVIVFKGGNTESGTRAAASHTGAMAGSNAIWGNLLKQVGAIQVHSIAEMVDVALLFSRGFIPRGRNAAVIGAGGGASVQAADDCADAGLILPMLPEQIRQTLKNLYATEAGRIFRNPVDIAPFTGSAKLLNTIKVIADSEEIDLMLIHIAFDGNALIDRKDVVKPYVEAILDSKEVVNKPLAVVLHLDATDEAKRLALEVYGTLREAGLPVYPSVGRAASAINKCIQYHEQHQNNRESCN